MLQAIIEIVLVAIIFFVFVYGAYHENLRVTGRKKEP
jgi:phosphotransferase system  glucose/maltose/N-acetylglucosamine-specific IIC component